MRGKHTQKINPWAGIIGITIIGPFVIDNNLNGQKYEQILRNQIVPLLQN